jgi:hypothetical protein
MSNNVFLKNGWGLKIQANCIDIKVNKNDFIGNTFDVATNGSLVLNDFSSNYDKSIKRFNDGTKEMSKTEKDEAEKRAEARRKAQEKRNADQEKAKQDATTAELDRKRLEAQAASLKAQKDNDLLSAQRDLAITETKTKIAEETAKAKLAEEAAKAELIKQNPSYANYLNNQAWAAAYSKMDKVFLPPNVSPFVVIGSNNVTTTVPIGPTSTR